MISWNFNLYVALGIYRQWIEDSLQLHCSWYKDNRLLWSLRHLLGAVRCLEFQAFSSYLAAKEIDFLINCQEIMRNCLISLQNIDKKRQFVKIVMKCSCISIKREKCSHWAAISLKLSIFFKIVYFMGIYSWNCLFHGHLAARCLLAGIICLEIKRNCLDFNKKR